MPGQKARPIADIGSIDGWSLSPQPPDTIFEHLNEPIPDDDTYVTSPTDGGSFEVLLNPLHIPRTGPHVLTVRLAGSAGVKVGISLKQGSGFIATRGVTLTSSSYENALVELTETEISQISQYTNLRALVSVGPVLIPGCTHNYPNSITGTWSDPLGTNKCPCFTGSFPLVWTKTAWVGVFSGCASTVVVTLTPPVTSTEEWSLSATSASYDIDFSFVREFTCGQIPSTAETGIDGLCQTASYKYLNFTQ
jgi:hypothetical protein